VISRILAVFAVFALLPAFAYAGQDPSPAPAQPSVAPQAAPVRQPPAGSGTVIRTTELRFHPVNESIIEAQTYLYYIQTPLSRPADNVWVPFNEQTEQSLLEDFKRLWATNFLDNLWIETLDEPFPNGVMGKRVIYHMEERPRVKIVDYTGSTKVERTKIDEKMKELGIALRLDSFLDQAVVKRVQGIVKSFMADKGYEFAEVTSSVEPLPAGPKLVKVVFDVVEGPKVKVRNINFNGNSQVSDRALARQMKSTKATNMLSWITGKGTYNENKFDEDAEKVIEYYRNKGYIAARVGQPEIKTIEDSADKETRWVQLNIPIDEGPRYRVGTFKFDGNKIIKTEFLEPYFKLKPAWSRRAKAMAASATSSSRASRISSRWAGRRGRLPAPRIRPSTSRCA
jgi:outer membrane protein insertion porin family